MIKKIFATLLAVVMVFPVSVAAAGLTRADYDPAFLARGMNASVKDSCDGYTSRDSVFCVGELVYYGYTGYSATTETDADCDTVRAIVYAEDVGAWVEIDRDIQYDASYADAAGQYGTGVEASQGSHYAKDYSGGTWTGHTSFSY